MVHIEELPDEIQISTTSIDSLLKTFDSLRVSSNFPISATKLFAQHVSATENDKKLIEKASSTLETSKKLELLDWIVTKLRTLTLEKSRVNDDNLTEKDCLNAAYFLIDQDILKDKVVLLDVFGMTCLSRLHFKFPAEVTRIWDKMGICMTHEMIFDLMNTVISGFSTLGIDEEDGLRALITIIKSHENAEIHTVSINQVVEIMKKLLQGLTIPEKSTEKFKHEASLRIQLILFILTDIEGTTETLPQDFIVELLYRSSCFISNNDHTDSNSKEGAADIVNKMAAIQNIEVEELVEKNASAMISTWIQPHFRLHPIVPKGTIPTDPKRVPLRQKPVEQVDAERHAFHEEQEWKETQDWHCLKWLLQQLPQPIDAKLLPKLIPIILTLIDDYQSNWRLKGVELFQDLLQKADGQDLRDTGIFSIFFKSLSDCATYQEDAKLMDEAIDAMINLVPIWYPVRYPDKRFETWQQILIDTLLRSLTFLRLEQRDVILVVFPHIERVLELMGILAVRAMPDLIIHCTEIMIKGIGNDVKLVGANLLLCMAKLFQLRFYTQRDLVLAACAETWNGLQDDLESDELRKVLKEIVVLLKKSCSQAKVDLTPDLAKLKELGGYNDLI